MNSTVTFETADFTLAVVVALSVAMFFMWLAFQMGQEVQERREEEDGDQG